MNKNTDKSGKVITTEAAKAFIAALTPADVREVYSGKPGCMCGCSGDYFVNPAHVQEAEAKRGYSITIEPSPGAMHMVLGVLKILQAHPHAFVQAGSIVYVPLDVGETWNYVLYVCNSKAI